MAARLLITGAGNGPGNNVIRSLKVGDLSLYVAGCHSDRFVLKKSAAARNFLVHPVTHRSFLRDVERVIARARVDLLIPTTDVDVRVLSPCAPETPMPCVPAASAGDRALPGQVSAHSLPAGPRRRRAADVRGEQAGTRARDLSEPAWGPGTRNSWHGSIRS